MKLQMAIDMADGAQALELVKKVSPWVDIVEIGTPLIMREGLEPVRKVKRQFPELEVLADTKIVDGGDIECADAIKAGADIVTVLAIADDATILEVVQVAHAQGRKVMADLITVSDIPSASLRLQALGADYLCVHVGVDRQKSGVTPLSDLKTLLSVTPCERTAVAGGISPKTVAQYAQLRPEILIAGGALASAENPAEAAKIMKEAIK